MSRCWPPSTRSLSPAVFGCPEMKQLNFSMSAEGALRALREDEAAEPMLLAVHNGKCAWVETTAGYDSEDHFTSGQAAQWWLSCGAGGGTRAESYTAFIRGMRKSGVTWLWFDTASEAVRYIAETGLTVSTTGFPE